ALTSSRAERTGDAVLLGAPAGAGAAAAAAAERDHPGPPVRPVLFRVAGGHRGQAGAARRGGRRGSGAPAARAPRRGAAGGERGTTAAGLPAALQRELRG